MSLNVISGNLGPTPYLNPIVGNLTCNSLSLSGPSSFVGDLTVTGNSLLRGAVTALGSLNVSGTTLLNGAVTALGALRVSGSTIVTGTTTINGNTSINGTLNVSGNTNIPNLLSVGNSDSGTHQRIILYSSPASAGGGGYIDYRDTVLGSVKGILGYTDTAANNLVMNNSVANGETNISANGVNGLINLRTSTTSRFRIQYDAKALLFGIASGTGSVFEIQSNDPTPGSVKYNFKANGTADATTWNSTSDERVKENIQNVTDSKEKIAQLKPRKYLFKVDNKEHYGFIGQELEQVLPQSVSLSDYFLDCADFVAYIKDCELRTEKELNNNDVYRFIKDNHSYIVKIVEKIEEEPQEEQEEPHDEEQPHEKVFNKYRIEKVQDFECAEEQEVLITYQKVDDFRTINNNEIVSLLVAHCQNLEERLAKIESKFL
jgi:hypothetical protein